MKDLYKAIGLTSEASDTEIRQNQHRDPDASYVFSSKKRKEVYDRAHKTLVKIGQLRSALDLPANSDWFNNYPDYKPAQRPRGKPRASAEQVKTHNKQSAKTDAASIPIFKWLFWVLVAIVSYAAITADKKVSPNDAAAVPQNASDGSAGEVEDEVSRYFYAGQSRYVTAGQLNVRAEPNANSEVIGSLEQYDIILFADRHDYDGWISVDHGNYIGYVSARYTTMGDVKAALDRKCKASGIERPATSLLVSESVKGEGNAFTINNGPSDDVIAKILSPGNKMYALAYIRASESIDIAGLPNGKYRLQYMSGLEYSPACGRFLTNARAGEDPDWVSFTRSEYWESVTYTLTRVVDGNFSPQSISVDEFMAGLQ